MPSSTSSTVLIAGSALLVAAAAAAFLPGKASSKDVAEITEIDEGPDEDYITEEDVCKIFDSLFMEMQGVLAQLSQQIQQLQMAGQQIPQAQLKQVLRSEFERALMVKQKLVFEANDVDADCLEEATWEFLDQPEKYPDAKKSVERFQELWENVSGESVVGKRPGQVSEEPSKVETMSAQKTVEAADVYFGAMTETMRELVQRYKAEGLDLNSPATAQKLQLEFTAAANDAGNKALESVGCTLRQFQKSVEANASNPMVGRSIQMIQMKQQQEMMAMGLPGM